MKKNYFTKGDFLIIFITLLAGVFSLISLNAGNKSASEVVIRIDGKETERFSLSEEGVYTFKTEFGLNVIEISKGRVRVIEADCPDKLDIKQGWIEKSGEKLICLPNHFVAEIVGEDSLDGVSK